MDDLDLKEFRKEYKAKLLAGQKRLSRFHFVRRFDFFQVCTIRACRNVFVVFFQEVRHVS